MNQQLILGTASWGMTYAGYPPPDEEELSAMFATAELYDATFDTARAYGGAELLLGRRGITGGRIMTKVKIPCPIYEQSLERKLAASLARAKVSDDEKFNTVYAHGEEGAEDYLDELIHSGSAFHYGVSGYNKTNCLRLSYKFKLSTIQLPVNLLDPAYDNAEREIGRFIARSIFLQGKLLGPSHALPRISERDSIGVFHQLHKLVKDLGRCSIADLCLAYVRSFAWIDGVVVGTKNLKELDTLYTLWLHEPLDLDERTYVQKHRPLVPAVTLDPRNWS